MPYCHHIALALCSFHESFHLRQNYKRVIYVCITLPLQLATTLFGLHPYSKNKIPSLFNSKAESFPTIDSLAPSKRPKFYVQSFLNLQKLVAPHLEVSILKTIISLHRNPTFNLPNNLINNDQSFITVIPLKHLISICIHHFIFQHPC